jgi:hypothetical protein
LLAYSVYNTYLTVKCRVLVCTPHEMLSDKVRGWHGSHNDEVQVILELCCHGGRGHT